MAIVVDSDVEIARFDVFFLSPPKDLGPSNGRVNEPVLRRGVSVLKMTPVSRVQ